MKSLVLVAPAVVLLMSNAFAQSYPSKSVSMVIPFPAGGAVDIVCRTVAQRLS